MKILFLVAIAALTVGVASCGVQTVAQPAGPPAAASGTALPAQTASASPQPVETVSSRPSVPPPTLTGPVTLTTADNGATVRLRVGQQVAAELASEGMFSWHVPTTAGAAVRRVSASGGYPGQQPAQATFLAVQPGSVLLTAIDDTACLHAQPACLPPQQEWRVTVVVSAG